MQCAKSLSFSLLFPNNSAFLFPIGFAGVVSDPICDVNKFPIFLFLSNTPPSCLHFLFHFFFALLAKPLICIFPFLDKTHADPPKRVSREEFRTSSLKILIPISCFLMMLARSRILPPLRLSDVFSLATPSCSASCLPYSLIFFASLTPPPKLAGYFCFQGLFSWS